MTDNRTIQFTFAIYDPELDAERRLKISSKLLRELRDSDEVEKVDRAEDFNPEAGSKPGFATLIGVLTAQVSMKNIKTFLSFLGDRLKDQSLEITVKVGDKDDTLKVYTLLEMVESEQRAKDRLAAKRGDNG